MTEHRSTELEDPTAAAGLVDRLNNADVRWDGTFVGLVPTIVSETARQLLAAGDDAVPQLVNALDDETKFVTAHVLLTLLSGVEYHTAPWNGLAIELSPDGEVCIDPRQQFALARRWRAWQQAAPHPRSLPSE